ncbi:3' exoribonuclease [Pyrolobus fumarii 1A]|uniref:Exosome complex component Rrp42 n=1 Tax=Pyrolobus fumarii (strain DSM 11204 / 1A) TaxID=694429 RepID=G0ECN0_PYRF1|nr:exosome complex protein Rrp42 [Pyrolobus fumarii]AEM39600.1 3' exoribonuclease [Pyrolobus fumarii 1A]
MSVTPWMLPVVPRLEKETIESLLERGARLDGRRLDQIRSIEIIPGYVGKAEGSALVKLGNTMVLAGVKMDITQPFPDTPDEAVLVVHAEFVPLASPVFEPGPPDENAIELARVVDRALREIRAVALDRLVLEPGKAVWRIYVDIYVLNHDGNLLDASMLASMAALMATRVPAVRRTGEGFAIERGRYTGLLPINNRVVTVTVAKIGSRMVVDPSFDEELVADVRLAVAVSDDNRIAGLQMMGMGYMTEKEISTAIEMAMRTAPVLLKALQEKVEPYRKKLLEEIMEKGEIVEATMEARLAAPTRSIEEAVEDTTYDITQTSGIEDQE